MMRIVLVAYDFPPIPSPQSLRWAYLVRELANQGHEIHVLTPDLPGYGAGGLPEIPSTVRVHRVYPGPLSALLRGRGKRKPVTTTSASTVAEATALPTAERFSPVHRTASGHAFHELNWKGRIRYRLENGLAPWRRRGSINLNWKGRLAERLKDALSWVMFPDYRTEWLPWARRVLRSLLANVRPDLVVTSHEPACSLPLGIEAKRLGYLWAADLGDPVLAPYTPKRWKARAHRLERDVLRLADMITVTAEKTMALLAQRHGSAAGKCIVLTQGYDATFADRHDLATIVPFDESKLELLYTGSFYNFRRADALISVVESLSGARLSIATINAPDYVVQAADRNPEKFRLLGFLPHAAALSAQRRCDVLVNIANADPVQVPGKVFEYLGAGRPILHLRGDAMDVTSELLDVVRGGWHFASGTTAFYDLLAKLRVLKDLGQLPGGASATELVAAHSWQALAMRWNDEVTRLMN